MNSLANVVALAQSPSLTLNCVDDLEASDSELVEALGQAGRKVIYGVQGPVSVVEETFSATDYSATTVAFDVHNDGLYLKSLPRFVLLYCNDAGRGDTPTVFCDSSVAASRVLNLPMRDTFCRLSTVYIGRDGEEHETKLIQTHPSTKRPVLVLGSRAYLRSSRGLSVDLIPTLRELSSALNEIYHAIECSIVDQKRWRKGDVVIFDNYQYLHARRADRPDEKRRLKRIWFD